MMPSTSVQIQSSAASRAAERMEAEKSEPPRPRVVARPSAVAPLNPVTTGMTPRSSRGSRRAPALRRVGSMSGEALPKTASVTMMSAAFTASAGVPEAFRYSAIRRAERRSPMATASSTERGGISLSISIPPAMRSNSAMRCAIPAEASVWRAGGSSSRQVSRWRSRSLAILACRPASSPASARRRVSSRRSVILDIAETTMATGRRAFCSAAMPAAMRMRSADPTLVPPNFMTNRSIN